MSRDVQVRVVFCDWLACLLRMKRPASYDVSLESVHQIHHHPNDLVTFNDNDDASSVHRTRLACNEV